MVTHHRLRSSEGEVKGVEPDPEAALEEPLIVRKEAREEVEPARDGGLALGVHVSDWNRRSRPHG